MYLGLAEGIAIYGLVLSILLLNKVWSAWKRHVSCSSAKAALATGFSSGRLRGIPDADAAQLDRIPELLASRTPAVVVVDQDLAESGSLRIDQVRSEGGRILLTQVRAAGATAADAQLGR